MFSSLRSRLLLTYIIIIAVVILVVTIGIILYLITNPLADRQTRANLERAAEQLSAHPELLAALREQPQAVVEQMEAYTSMRSLVISDTGQTMADSQESRSATLSRLNPRVLRFSRGVSRDADNRLWFYTSRRLSDGSSLVLAAPRQGSLNLVLVNRLQGIFRDDILPPLIRAGFLAMLLALVLAFGMSNWISTPLRRIAAASRQVAEGRYSHLSIDGPKEVKELSQAFNEMSANVRASQQSQRDFVLQVSHELKTPLTSIQGFAQAILDGTASTSLELQQAAGVISDEAGRMHRMVLELLDLARLDSGIATMERAPVDICVLLRTVGEKLAPQAGEAHIDLQLDLHTVPPILGDADRLAQVFTNLLDNAIKFTPGGESVFVRTGMDSHFVEIAVQDHGPGIPQEDLERIFDRFYQSDKSRRGGSGHGVGLGLPIAREIVNSHGGSLTVKNHSLDTISSGCTFLVRLPIAPPGDISGYQKSSVNNAG